MVVVVCPSLFLRIPHHVRHRLQRKPKTTSKLHNTITLSTYPFPGSPLPPTAKKLQHSLLNAIKQSTPHPPLLLERKKTLQIILNHKYLYCTKLTSFEILLKIWFSEDLDNGLKILVYKKFSEVKN